MLTDRAAFPDRLALEPDPQIAPDKPRPDDRGDESEPSAGSVAIREGLAEFPFYFQFQAWPIGVKLMAASTLGVGALALSYLLGLPAYGFTVLLLYPAVLGSAYLRGRAAGFACTLVTAASIAALLHVDEELPRATTAASVTAVALFIVAGLSASMMMSTLRRALRDLGQAHSEAVALELEKDLLLRELRHRIKNDLANVCAILQIEARGLDGEAAATLQRAVNRVHVIARLHERMERDRHSPVVEAGSFIEALCKDFRTTFLTGRNIEIEATCSRLSLSAERAVALGLIANELITNALKHAFPHGRAGTIRVALSSTASDGELIVRDDGVGIAAEHGLGSGKRLVHALARKLAANLTLQPSDRGTYWRLRFGYN